MSKRSPDLLIQDIIESAEKILDYTKGLTYDEFKAYNMRIDAVIRNFEIIVKPQIGFRKKVKIK